MNENEFDYNAKTYVAVETEKPCDKCAFVRDIGCVSLKIRGIIPECLSRFRADGKRVFFVEKGANK